MLGQAEREFEFATYAAPPWVRTRIAHDGTTLSIRRFRRFVPGEQYPIERKLSEIVDVETSTAVVRPALVIAVMAGLAAVLGVFGASSPGGVTRIAIAVFIAAVSALLSLRTSLVVVTDIDEVIDVSLGFGERDEARDLVAVINHAVGLAEARAAHDA